ncbi:hypothetical protein F4679DRAFT_209830 [Xylaria curta]|nr:hypothetical protein F4679DRAFT_209830 [Xylaria curta]
MAHSPTVQSESLRLTLPSSFQQFHFFKWLPYDIRYMIWQQAIFKPGIHFLKLVSTSTGYASSAGVDRDELITFSERQTDGTTDEDVAYSAVLKPIFGLECANNSNYIVVNKTLCQLADSCDEAKYLVEKILAQPGNLRLYDGQLVLLQRASDVVCIDYPDMTHARCLGKWAEHLDLDQLAKIRQLAIRYHHEWDNALVCPHCGRVHSYLGKHPYPRHVYEFASLFKNLEAFYFIDYLTLRRPQCLAPNSSQCQAEFANGECGRTYFEVDTESCTTHTRVHETLSWLRNNYIVHCRCKSQGPSDPENVCFGVLGCEWDSDQRLAPTKRATPTKKKRFRNHNPLRNIIMNPSSPQPLNHSTLPVVFGDLGKSRFDFDLKISY